jgi:ketosteroid isomerase-like protein
MKPAESDAILGGEHIFHKGIRAGYSDVSRRDLFSSPLRPRPRSLAFGPFRLDLGSCRLYRDGGEVILRAQAFRVLAVLARSIGEPVNYEQMAREAWNGAPVSRHAVAVTIVEARKALLEYGSWIRYRRRLGFCLEIAKSEKQVDGAEIQAFEQRLAEALRVNDVERIRAAYAPSKVPLLLGARSLPPSVGTEAYSRSWDYPLSSVPGPVRFVWERWRFSTEGNLGYAHGTFCVTASAEYGKNAVLPVQVTHILRKIRGNWMIVHEHVSFPSAASRDEVI